MTVHPIVSNLIMGQMEAIRETLARARQEPSYRYPWTNLEEALANSGRSHLTLVGYGSLVNRESASRTLDKASLDSREPAIAFGARRIFNYEMPLSGASYGQPTEPAARAALNIRMTGKIDDAVNGVMVEIPLKNVRALREREVGYDLEPTACLSWNYAETPPYTAYLLQAPDEPYNGRSRTNETLLPHREYYRVCRAGAQQIGEDFLQLWLDSTYLADGVTVVRDWEEGHFPDVAGR